MGYDVESIERYLRRRLRGRDRNRFERAKRFVDEATRRSADSAAAHRLRARWLGFLSRRRPVQTEIFWPDLDFLRRFAGFIGLPPADMPEFVELSLLGRLWRASAYVELLGGDPEVVVRLTRATGRERFEHCRQDGNGIILVTIHSQFSRLSVPYLRHQGQEILKVGIPRADLVVRGFGTQSAQRLELARQMHAAKHQLARGGIVLNAPDALEQLDNSIAVNFLGRQRRIAAGFAELAIRTRASVVPVVYRFSPRGFFLQEFEAPFDDPGPQSTPEARIGALVGQYARFLADEWLRYPWNIQWKQMRHYCEWPETDPGVARGTATAPAISPLAQALPQ